MEIKKVITLNKNKEGRSLSNGPVDYYKFERMNRKEKEMKIVKKFK